MPKAPKTIAQLKPRHRQQKTSARGYDWEWQKFRKAALKCPEDFGLPHDFMYCRDCKTNGRLVPTVDIHHKIPLQVRPDLKFSPSNLEGLCKRCHARRRDS